MLAQGSNNILAIFDGAIRINKELPKWKQALALMKENNNIVDYVSYDTILEDGIEGKNGLTGFTYTVHQKLFDTWKYSNGGHIDGLFFNPTGEINQIDNGTKEPWYKKVRNTFKNRFTHAVEVEESVEIDALEFFSQVKLAIEASSVYIDRTVPYLKALKMANISGQTALKETLTMNLVNNKYESVLFAHGLYKVLTEEALIEFYKKSEKGLKLTYIENYGKIIPVDIVEQIHEINQLEVFDNYCILHYDPNGEVFLNTKKEKEKERAKRRDPVLFGMLSGSHKLYYINDWEDEFCDLSFDKIMDTLDKELVEQNFLKESIQIENL